MPALSFIDAFQTRCPEIEVLLVLPERNIAAKRSAFPCAVTYLGISPIRLRLDRNNIFAVFDFCKVFFSSAGMVLKFRPDAVVGFGSLVCIPIILWAWFFRIPTLIHEQNVIPGKANQLLAFFTDRIAISFEESRDYLDNFRRKTVYCGNPLRSELQRVPREEALRFFGFTRERVTILVMGGSQGSHTINEEFIRCLSAITDKSGIQVIHLTGENDYARVLESYNNLGVSSRVFDFLQEMRYAYSVADVVLARAGALSISETAFFAIPAILVPYPYAWQHQFANARILEKRGCGIIIEDNKLGIGLLKETLESLAFNSQRRQEMRAGYHELDMLHAGERLVEAVLSLA